MEPIINFLNENSGAITALATVILAAITWRYVQLTKMMLKASNIPVVRLFLYAREINVTLCVQNIGIGFARDIKFTGDLSFQPITPLSKRDVTLGELEPFKSRIDYLAPGQKIETALFLRDDMARVPNHKFDITVTYRDLANTKNQKTFTFEIGNWRNTDQFGSPHTDDIAKALEAIAGKLEDITR